MKLVFFYSFIPLFFLVGGFKFPRDLKNNPRPQGVPSQKKFTHQPRAPPEELHPATGRLWCWPWAKLNSNFCLGKWSSNKKLTQIAKGRLTPISGFVDKSVSNTSFGLIQWQTLHGSRWMELQVRPRGVTPFRWGRSYLGGDGEMEGWKLDQVQFWGLEIPQTHKVEYILWFVYQRLNSGSVSSSISFCV